MKSAQPEKLLRLLLPQLVGNVRLGITLRGSCFSLFVTSLTKQEIAFTLQEIKPCSGLSRDKETILNSANIIVHYSKDVCMFSVVADYAIKYMLNVARVGANHYPQPVSMTEANLYILEREE